MLRSTAALMISTVLLVACEQFPQSEEVEDASDPVNVVDATNLNELMLTVADPDEAVAYFRNALSKDPERLEFRRGYAQALSRAGEHIEASLVYRLLVEDGLASTEDRIGYAEALGRANAWDQVEGQLALLPDLPQSYRLNMLRAMAADQRSDWATSDRYYEAARRLTPRPANVMNNWGVSKLSRGDLVAAETALYEAVTYDPQLFSAKNNLVISRGLQGKFRLPVIPMNEEERAQLLHNLAVIALRQGKEEVGRGLLEEAVATHPRHFEPAINKLEALSTEAS
ncbi:MAG: tetratricopeptide repeat protein [Pseudomonadota bacterium]